MKPCPVILCALCCTIVSSQGAHLVDWYPHSKAGLSSNGLATLLLALNSRSASNHLTRSDHRYSSSRRSLVPSAVASDVKDGSSLLDYIKSEMRPNSYLLREISSAERIESACKGLEDATSKPAFPQDLMVMDGKWKLVYSSALALPTPPVEQFSSFLEGLPLAPRNVEQRIDVVKRRVVNKVSLAPWPVDSPLSSIPGIGDVLKDLETSEITLELDHSFSVEGEGGDTGGRRMAAAGSVMQLNLENVRRNLDQKDGMNEQANSNFLFDMIPKQSEYEIPVLLSSFAAGKFDTTYVDEQIRISRGAELGPFRELRVFVRADSRGRKVYSSWQEEEDALAAAAAAGKLDEVWATGDRWQEGGLEETEAMDFSDDDGMPD